MHTDLGAVDIGTGLAAGAENATGRIVRIDGATKPGSGALADYVEMVWLTPAMDGLFTGAGSERRRFLDRLILCFDPGHRPRASRFERAMQQRNRLLADGVRDNAQFDGLEDVMAETGVAIAAARAEAAAALAAISERRRARDPASPFPWAAIALEGTLEADLDHAGGRGRGPLQGGAALWARARSRGRPHARRAAPLRPRGRARAQGDAGAAVLDRRAEGAADRARSRPRRVVAERQSGRAPILLLDEMTAHLDAARRAALFDEILRSGRRRG